MEAKDFRIGNLILEGSDVLTIGNTYQNGFDFIYKGGCRFVEFIDAKPIPLTEEILLKCGIEKWINSTFEIRKNLDNTFSVYAWRSGIDVFISHFEFLHNFQNWYYFTFKNEELEINL